MPYIKVIHPDDASGRLEKIYRMIRGPGGQVDNVLQIHSLRPHSLEGHMSLGCELVSATPHPSLPTTVYPIEEVLDEFKVRYFRDNVSYMIAYAIMCKYDMIRFYGIDCLIHSTYIEHKAPTEFWCGVARGRGIRLGVAPSSGLCRLSDDSAVKPLVMPEMGVQRMTAEAANAYEGGLIPVNEDVEEMDWVDWPARIN